VRSLVELHVDGLRLSRIIYEKDSRVVPAHVQCGEPAAVDQDLGSIRRIFAAFDLQADDRPGPLQTFEISIAKSYSIANTLRFYTYESIYVEGGGIG
jgi:hypothetical protein